MSTNPKDLVGITKPPLHLVPPALGLHTSQAMANGAKKYGPYNWREHPVKMTVYIGAAMRHLAELLDGENTARDSGVHHAAHVAACCAIILDALETGNLIDDRPRKGCASDVIERMTTKAAPVEARPVRCPHVRICLPSEMNFFESHDHECGLTLGHVGDHADGDYRWANETDSPAGWFDPRDADPSSTTFVSIDAIQASLHDDLP